MNNPKWISHKNDSLGFLVFIVKKDHWILVKMHSTNWHIEVDFAVDMNNYEGDPYQSVSIYGSFNNWCLECDSLSDEDGDGVFEGSIRDGKGELEYKFALDKNVERQETFEVGMPCTKTTGQYTNRVIQVEGTADLGVVCFEFCDCP